jgi:hypothetical protein
MRCVCDIARRYKMQKVVLTVFKGEIVSGSLDFSMLRAFLAGNQAAYLFYKATGLVQVPRRYVWTLIVYTKLRR